MVLKVLKSFFLAQMHKATTSSKVNNNENSLAKSRGGVDSMATDLFIYLFCHFCLIDSDSGKRWERKGRERGGMTCSKELLPWMTSFFMNYIYYKIYFKKYSQ